MSFGTKNHHRGFQTRWPSDYLIQINLSTAEQVGRAAQVTEVPGVKGEGVQCGTSPTLLSMFLHRSSGKAKSLTLSAFVLPTLCLATENKKDLIQARAAESSRQVPETRQPVPGAAESKSESSEALILSA